MDTEGTAVPPGPELDQALAHAIRQLIAGAIEAEGDPTTPT